MFSKMTATIGNVGKFALFILQMDSTHNNIYFLSLETYIKLVSVLQIRKIKMQYQFFLELIRNDLNKQGENYND